MAIGDSYNYLYFFIFVTALVFLILAKVKKDIYFSFISGATFVATAIFVITEGHSLLTSEFLSRIFWIILLGLGAYVIIDGIRKELEGDEK